MQTHRRKTNTKNPLGRRRGAVMVAAAICLLLATVLLASALQLATTGRQQVRRQQLRMQADWLAEAGLERATARLATETGYRGETWNIVADELDGRHAGRVVITVNPTEGDATLRVVTVEASYPAAATLSAKTTRRAELPAATE